jgi:hypothetical protein
MAKPIEAFRDERGNLYTSPELAIVADIAAALGRVGDEGGLTSGVARLILDKRREIEQAFADLDRLMGTQPRLAELLDHPVRRALRA